MLSVSPMTVNINLEVEARWAIVHGVAKSWA